MGIDHSNQLPIEDNPLDLAAGKLTPSKYNGDTHPISDGAGNTWTVDQMVAEHLGWFNVKQYGAKGDGITDDTVSINNTVTACFNAGRGTVYFPAGTYPCNGAFQTSNGYNAIIPIPYVGTLPTAPVEIVFKGCIRPHQPYGYYIDFIGNPTQNVSIITSTKTGTGTVPALIGTPHNTTGTQMTFVTVFFEDLIIRQNNTNGLIGLQLGGAMGAAIRKCNVDVTVTTPGQTPNPTNTNMVGVVLPQFNNSGLSILEDCFIVGQYNGVWACEMATIKRCTFQSNYGGIIFWGGDHSVALEHVIILENCYPLYAAGDSNNGGKVFVIGDNVNIEDAKSGSYWQENIAHIYDPTNLIHGKMNIHRVISGSGSTTAALTINGGSNISPNIFIF